MAAAKKVAKKKKPQTATKTRPAAKKPSAKSRTKKVPRAAAKKTRPPKKRSAGLGRVKVSADARLDLVFQKDYQAREIFEFLKVQTLRELEQHGPDEIIERLTGPMVQTVQRIRKTLAMINRYLARDEKFAKAFQAEVAAR
jgi:hypothetical protein